MDNVCKDIWRVREEKQPRAGKTPETPIAFDRFIESVTGQQCKGQRQPGQEQVPAHKTVFPAPGPNDSCRNQSNTDAGGGQQRKTGHRGFSFQRKSQQTHNASFIPFAVKGEPCMRDDPSHSAAPESKSTSASVQRLQAITPVRQKKLFS